MIKDGLDVTPVRSTSTEAMMLAIKRAGEADKRWLFGPKGDTGVCEGIESVSVMGIILNIFFIF